MLKIAGYLCKLISEQTSLFLGGRGEHNHLKGEETKPLYHLLKSTLLTNLRTLSQTRTPTTNRDIFTVQQ